MLLVFPNFLNPTAPMRKNNCNGDIHITTFYLLFFSSLDPLAFPLKDGDVIYGWSLTSFKEIKCNSMLSFSLVTVLSFLWFATLDGLETLKRI